MKLNFRNIICIKVVASLLVTSLSISIPSNAFAASSPSALSSEELVKEANEELIVENEAIEERIDTFLKICSEEANPNELPPTPEYSCSLEAEALAPILEELEKSGARETQSEALASCAEHPSIVSRNVISNFTEDLTEELQCLKEDVEYYEQSCGEEFQCNMIRSGIAASRVFPEVIEGPIRNFLTSKAASATDSKHCMDESRSNCLTEVWTALVANITDTMSSLWALAKTGWNSLWNLSDFFDRKSDELHVAANQKKEDVVSFWRSPGEWIYKKFNGLKDSVEDWMKESVFCQEWSGTPHMPGSVCVRPLETFGCVNCGDMTNAFCAAAGVIVSEIGLVVATAGTGTAAGIVAHMGLKAAGKAAIKVSSKIASVAPKMSKATKAGASTGKMSKVTTKAKVVAEAAVEASRVAVRISSEKIAHAKDLVVKYKDGLMSTRAAQVTLKVVDIASTPMIVLDKAGEIGIIASERLMARVVPGTTGRFLQRRAMLRQITPETDQSHRARERLNFTLRHQARGARTVSTYEQKPKRNSGSSTDGARASRERNRDREHSDRDDPSDLTSHAQNSNSDSNSNPRRETQSPERTRSEEDRRRAQREEQERRQRQEQAQHNATQQHQAEQGKETTDRSSVGRKIVLADAALKASGIGREQSAEDMVAEAQRLIEEQDSGQVKSQTRVTSKDDALKAIGADSKEGAVAGARANSQDQAREKYERLRETYSQNNRNNYVKSMSQATGVDPSVASSYFDKRQREIEDAGKVLFPQESERTRKKKSMISDLSKELEGLDKEMDTLSDNFERDVESDDSLASSVQRDRTSDEDSGSGGNSGKSARATPTATPTSIATPGAMRSTAAAGGGSTSSGSDAGASALTQEAVKRAELESAGLIEVISAGEAKILEGLINVNALRLINGEPSELAALRENFGDTLDDVTAHGKIRSSRGEFLFIQTSKGFLVFKKKAKLWVRVESSSLENLLKKKIVASR